MGTLTVDDCPSNKSKLSNTSHQINFQWFNLEGPGSGWFSGVSGAAGELGGVSDCSKALALFLALAWLFASLHFFLFALFSLSLSSLTPFFFPVSLSLFYLSLSFSRYFILLSGSASWRSRYLLAISAPFELIPWKRQVKMFPYTL